MKASSEKFLKNLVTSIGPSGYEDEPAKIWQAEARKFADDVSCDMHGSSHAVVNKGGGPRIMFAGHYDEIGFMVSYIDDQGYLWVRPIGGWDSQIPQGHHVIIRTKKGHLPGVFGKQPIHMMKAEQRTKVTAIDEMWVDIGAKDKKAAEKLVEVGDPMVLGYSYTPLQGDLVASKSMDDRVGAFAILEAAKILSNKKPKVEVHAVATVQEEIGLRGATTSTFGVDPVVGIAVDVTFATDHPSMGAATKLEGEIKIGSGPVIVRGANVNHKVFELLVKAAKEEKIPYQVNAEPRGTGTDANAIQLTRAGVAAGLVGVPNRYMHSPCEICSLKDIENTAKLLAAFAMRVTSRTNFVPYK